MSAVESAESEVELEVEVNCETEDQAGAADAEDAAEESDVRGDDSQRLKDNLAKAAESAEASSDAKMDDARFEHLNELEEWKRDVRNAEMGVSLSYDELHIAQDNLDLAKARVKEREAQVQEAVKRLRQVIAGDPWDKGLGASNNGVSKLAPGDDETFVSEPDKPAEPTAESEPTQPNDAWRSVLVSELVQHGLHAGTVAILHDNSIQTIGAIADWTDKGKDLTDLTKIGPGKATAIEDALEKFWAAHPEFTSSESEPESETVEEESETPGAAKEGQTGTDARSDSDDAEDSTDGPYLVCTECPEKFEISNSKWQTTAELEGWTEIAPLDDAADPDLATHAGLCPECTERVGGEIEDAEEEPDDEESE